MSDNTDYYDALSPQPESKAPLTPPEDTTPAIAPELLSGPLSDDLRVLLPLLTKLGNTAGRTREEETARRNRLMEVRKLVFALQQTPPAPVMTADDQAQAKRDRENTLTARNERIAQLRAALKR